MPALREGESYQHLGVPTGWKVDQSPVGVIKTCAVDVKSIATSLLAPWQKLQAVRTFITSRLHYSFLTARVPKKDLEGLEKEIKKFAKTVLDIPTRASAELVYLPPSTR
ncbi:hypothetical protein FOCC_FOCC012400 [Frankliniella occidentalis]|nr:hypothetical protein FOCC_FOCC012400 [Frankliniella occidentalis]